MRQRSHTMEDTELRFDRAIAAFQAAHLGDPRVVTIDGDEVPFAFHYHRRLAYWVVHLDGQASLAVTLAAYCQHIRRWTIPRTDFPEGLTGYKRWRSKLAMFHAEQARDVLTRVGYHEDLVKRVGEIIIKKGVRSDPEAQLLEDAVCMVFLETEFEEFAAKHERVKIVEILRKTWDKMSPRGRATASQLAQQLPPELRELVAEAAG